MKLFAQKNVAGALALIPVALLFGQACVPIRAPAATLTESTDDLALIIWRLGAACPNEEDLGDPPHPEKPRDTTTPSGKPCIYFKKVVGKKMSQMSEREPLQNYLERNEFQCSRSNNKITCYRELVHVFSPILLGQRMNPDIRNRYIMYVVFTQVENQYVPEEENKIYLTRFTHQDKPNDPAIGSDTHATYPAR